MTVAVSCHALAVVGQTNGRGDFAVDDHPFLYLAVQVERLQGQLGQHHVVR